MWRLELRGDDLELQRLSEIIGLGYFDALLERDGRRTFLASGLFAEASDAGEAVRLAHDLILRLRGLARALRRDVAVEGGAIEFTADSGERSFIFFAQRRPTTFVALPPLPDRPIPALDRIAHRVEALGLGFRYLGDEP